MNWYLQSGKDSDVVTSTRIRFARNLQGFKFNLKNPKDIEELKNKIKENTYAIGYGLKYLELKDMDDITKMSLVEKNLISKDYALKNKTGAILINDEENICIMINEEDHLRMQLFGEGIAIEELMNLAIEIDQKLERLVDYAFSEKYGYLTACPTNVGTGLRVSVMVHLPGLAETGNLNKILHIVNNFGMSVRGVYGEGSQSMGNMYQISNNQTLGLTEQEIVKNMKQSNIISVLKHFPGYGDNVDTHTGIAIDERTMEEFEQTDFIPFQSGIQNGTPCILVNHNIVKCMDSTMPASLSKNVHEILRNKLNFTDRKSVV